MTHSAIPQTMTPIVPVQTPTLSILDAPVAPDFSEVWKIEGVTAQESKTSSLTLVKGEPPSDPNAEEEVAEISLVSDALPETPARSAMPPSTELPLPEDTGAAMHTLSKSVVEFHQEPDLPAVARGDSGQETRAPLPPEVSEKPALTYATNDKLLESFDTTKQMTSGQTQPAMPVQIAVPAAEHTRTAAPLLDTPPPSIVQTATLVSSAGLIPVQQVSKPNGDLIEQEIKTKVGEKKLSHFPSQEQLVRAQSVEVKNNIPVATMPAQPVITTGSGEKAMPLKDIGMDAELFPSVTLQRATSEQTTTSLQTITPANNPQTVRVVAHQMAVAVAQNTSGLTEIMLSPEELGKVRMVMTAQDATVTMIIQAERPETQELLRRQIETLAQEFRNMGYGTLNFAFEGGQNEQTAQSDQQDDPARAQNEHPIEPTTVHSTVVVETAGLDLRL